MIEAVGTIMIIIAIPIAIWDANNGFVVRWRRLALLAGVVLGVALLASPAVAHDHENMVNDQWMKGLMQPDNPTVPCCGTADAYWCDNYYARDGKAFCKITDDRPDEPLGRPHIPVGTEVEIPPHKLKFDRGNPTGHHVVFVSRALYVHCFVQGSGT